MLLKTSDLRNYTILATDGEIGRVTDLLFDDARWTARWFVIETGSWLSSREVLLPLSHLNLSAVETTTINVDLSREQLKNSPGVDTHKPVSRQLEDSLYGHYGWTPYWGGLAATGAGAGYLVPPIYLMPGTNIPSETEPPRDRQQNEEDTHLRSCRAIHGYHIEATDGDIGHVEDFLVDDSDWAIRYIIVDTKNWWPGKHVLISPGWAKEIRWSDRTLSAHLTRDQIKAAPEYDQSRPFGRAEEDRLFSHYGLAGYWDRSEILRKRR